MRTAAVIVATAGLVLPAAGCGGSSGNHVAQLGAVTATAQSHTRSTAAGKSYAAALAYARCMRSHGVPNFPDPRQVGGGIQIAGSSLGMSPQSPTFASAQRSCRHLLPGGGRPTRADRQRALARMLHISRCMRAHGVTGFPDPTLTPPNRSGYSDIMSNGVAWLAIPAWIDLRSPLVRQAAAACELGLS